MDLTTIILIATVAVLFIFSIVLLLVVLQMRSTVVKLNDRINKLCRGADAGSLEADIQAIMDENLYLMSEVKEHKAKIRNIYKRLEKSYQKMALVKYDAFRQMGGQLSFVICLLDENNNGFLINSVHSSDGCYSYTKEIVEGSCELGLGDEEAAALEQAKGITPREL